jgi:hydroxyethylthiazole kinase-like uncharacterized protein yjeF
MNSEWIIGSYGPRISSRLPLLDIAGSRSLETDAAEGRPAGYLMQSAGLALAQLALAVAPYPKSFWVACGRGNNGGDGLEAALHLHQWGKSVHISMPPGNKPLPTDAAQALARVQQAGMDVFDHAPDHWEVCIDALLGIGLTSAPGSSYADWIARMNAGAGTIISADLPSGLLADTGSAPGACVRASHTLSMLSLKPGLLTAQGRDMSGDIWLNTLGAEAPASAYAWLNPAPSQSHRAHASHKGSYGDVAIVGGSAGMEGAAVLAARAALQSGAGRVFLALLSPGQAHPGIELPADLMQRHPETLHPEQLTMVIGCGGGFEMTNSLPRWFFEAKQLVVDADALNAMAASTRLQTLLRARPQDTTVITPHPLEAARLLGCSVAEVQADRIASAQHLAAKFQCAIILKGSGSVIAAPQKTPHINPTGNGKLAIAGTGDVLAGMTGAALAHHHSAWVAACEACYCHGALADAWPQDQSLTASKLLSCI